MNNARQLELNLEIALEEAAEIPETVDVIGLWQRFESELLGLSQRDQLQAAGNILMELAGLCETKAEVLWEDWQDAHNADGPVMGGDWLQGVTRQTQELDFSDLVQRSYYRSASEAVESNDEDSVVSSVDKESALALVEALDSDGLKAQALAVSHAENVSAWVGLLSDATQMRSSQRLVDVKSQLDMPLVEVWLAALLGGFELEQRGTFYETAEVWICSGGLEVSR